MSAHTPGPWFAIPHPEWPGANYRITSDPSEPWANFGPICYTSPQNAPLIAASPSLLALLRDCERYATSIAALGSSEAVQLAARCRAMIDKVEFGK